MTDAEPPTGERPDLPDEHREGALADEAPRTPASEPAAPGEAVHASGQHSDAAPAPWLPPEADISSFGAYPPPDSSTALGASASAREPLGPPAQGEFAPPAYGEFAPPAYGEFAPPAPGPGRAPYVDAVPPPYGAGPVSIAPDTVRLGDHVYVRAGYLPAPGTRPKKTLGLVAMIAAFAVFAMSVPVSVWVGLTLGPQMAHTATGFAYPAAGHGLPPAQVVAALVVDIQFLLGTGIGLWALVQGIVAAATERGRAYGVTAIVVAAAAPVFSVIAAVAALTASMPQR